jgi:hypothetical protein
MYANSSSSGVYHLVGESQDKTLCGLGVAPIVINRSAESSILHLTVNKPEARELCEECARVETERRA